MTLKEFICGEDIYPNDFLFINDGTATSSHLKKEWEETGRYIAISGGKKGETTTAMPITPDIVWEVQE